MKKKIPVFGGILLIAGLVSTLAFTHPIKTFNGRVRGYSTSSMTIDTGGQTDETFYIPQGGNNFVTNSGANTIGAGSKVTVWAECRHGGAQTANTAANNGNPANDHVCIAVGIWVRSAAANAVPATGGNGSATPSATSATGTGTPGAAMTGTPSAVTTGTPSVMTTGTPGAMTTGTAAAGAVPATGGTGTPMVACPTSTPTMMPGSGTPTSTPTSTPTVAATTGTATSTATPMVPCATATP